MLVRKIEKNIANWIKNGEKTLIVQGGRQVGKTYTIRKCLKRSNFKYVEFNFIDDFRLSKIVDNFADMDDLILKDEKLFPEKRLFSWMKYSIPILL